eukprot:TRINITY_DN24175_c0_g1_i1.p1 TRINITY_DN24175_c0_g1~~TRINITY_DN24175_c0_g1_i1.p1  ORF type:complete len:448 (+),score=102.03 TRINITY_DN24175_c0_g1_i1:23-1366(+)
MSAGFGSLDASVLLEIMKFCPAETLFRLREVCKRLRDHVPNAKFVDSIFWDRTGLLPCLVDQSTIARPLDMLKILLLDDRQRDSNTKRVQTLFRTVLKTGYTHTNVCTYKDYVFMNPLGDPGNVLALAASEKSETFIGMLPSRAGFCDVLHSPTAGDFLLCLGTDNVVSATKLEKGNFCKTEHQMKRSVMRILTLNSPSIAMDARSCLCIRNGWIGCSFPKHIELFHVSEDILATLSEEKSASQTPAEAPPAPVPLPVARIIDNLDHHVLDIAIDPSLNVLAVACRNGDVLAWHGVCNAAGSKDDKEDDLVLIPEVLKLECAKEEIKQAGLALKDGFLCCAVEDDGASAVQVFKFSRQQGKFEPWKRISVKCSLQYGFMGDMHHGLLIMPVEGKLFVWDLLSRGTTKPIRILSGPPAGSAFMFSVFSSSGRKTILAGFARLHSSSLL